MSLLLALVCDLAPKELLMLNEELKKVNLLPAIKISAYLRLVIFFLYSIFQVDL